MNEQSSQDGAQEMLLHPFDSCVGVLSPPPVCAACAARAMCVGVP